MYEYVDAHETRQTIVGGKILSLYHKVAFFMYERAVFWEYGRAMGITFLGKSEHMRYINFGKFYIEETKKILKSFQTRFSSLKRKRKMAFFVGVASYPKLLRTTFFKRLLACSGRFQVLVGGGGFALEMQWSTLDVVMSLVCCMSSSLVFFFHSQLYVYTILDNLE